jgi:hypothetical protein
VNYKEKDGVVKAAKCKDDEDWSWKDHPRREWDDTFNERNQRQKFDIDLARSTLAQGSSGSGYTSTGRGITSRTLPVETKLELEETPVPDEVRRQHAMDYWSKDPIQDGSDGGYQMDTRTFASEARRNGDFMYVCKPSKGDKAYDSWINAYGQYNCQWTCSHSKLAWETEAPPKFGKDEGPDGEEAALNYTTGRAPNDKNTHFACASAVVCWKASA